MALLKQGMTDAPDPLATLRQQINDLDDQLIALLAKRYALLADVVKIKAANNISHRVEARVKAVLDRNIKNGAAQGLPEQMVHEIWHAIIEAAHRYEHQFLKN